MKSTAAVEMANPQHLENIQQGAKAWNSWRQGQGHLRANLRGADLSQASLAEALLARANLRESRLRGADLRGANLRNANLREADLREADLRGANLTRSDLRDADLREADLRGADLRGASLEGARLQGADFRGALLNKEGTEYVQQKTQSATAAPAKRPADAAAPGVQPQEDAERAQRPARRFPKAALQVTLLLLATGAALGLFFALSPSGERMIRTTGHPADRAVLEAVAGHWEIVSVTTQDGVMTIHMELTQVGEAQYIPMLSSVCSAINQVPEASATLVRIRIVNQARSQGWVFESPQKCADIEQSSGMALHIAIAAGSHPLQTGAASGRGRQQVGKQP